MSTRKDGTDRSLRRDGTSYPSELKRSSLLTPRHRARLLPRTPDSRSRTCRSVSKLIASIAAPALLAAAMQAEAGCGANLMANIHGQPAMQAIQWSISQGSRTIVSTLRHRFSVSLNCGTYYITATRGDLTRTRTATLISGVSDIIIEMGE